MNNLRISNVFAKSANQLPKETRAKLMKIFVFLTTDPNHPSLRLKKIKGSRLKNVYECRIDNFYRLILAKIDPNNYDLVYVATHDVAIEYGKTLSDTNELTIKKPLKTYGTTPSKIHLERTFTIHFKSASLEILQELLESEISLSDSYEDAPNEPLFNIVKRRKKKG